MILAALLVTVAAQAARPPGPASTPAGPPNGTPAPTAAPPAATPAPPAPVPSYLGLAERLRQDGQYDACAVEALRHGYSHPEDASSADERAALCLDLAGRWAEARDLVLNLLGDPPLSAHARFRLCYTEVFLNDAPPADRCSPSGGAGSREEARYLVLASYTKVMRAMRQRRYGDAAAQLADWPRVPPGTLADWEAQDLGFLEQSRHLAYRSPALAGLLSAVIPGAGRAYLGRWGDAVFSFVLIGAPAGIAAYEFTRSGASSVGGWILASIAGLFYLGDIYGSVVGAVLYDQQQGDALAAHVKEAYLGRADP